MKINLISTHSDVVSGHVGYQRVKKIVDDNLSSEEEVFVKEDGMKTTHHSSIHQKDEPYTYARELVSHDL